MLHQSSLHLLKINNLKMVQQSFTMNAINVIALPHLTHLVLESVL